MRAEGTRKESSPEALADMPQEGDLIAGKYLVERVIGTGGMGVVLAAHHTLLEERVALKFLLPKARVSPDAVARFLREAQATTKIKNEHVARVKDVGQLDDSAPYIVMEYLDGSDLATWLTERGPLPVEQAVDFVLQACEAIAEAHTHGIVHRDLKPPNLFCVRKPDGALSIKVLDFGISKITAPRTGANSLTATTTIMGSPIYMSPEQMSHSKGVDTRTDIWSIGVILFELITGRPPFEAEAVTELAVKVTNEPAPRVIALRPEVPRGLDAAIAKCLEKDRVKRFQTVAELALALEGFGTARARVSVEGIVGIQRQMSLTDSARFHQELPKARISGQGSLGAPQGEALAAAETAGPGYTARTMDTVLGVRATRRNVARGALIVAGSMVASTFLAVTFLRATAAPATASSPVVVSAPVMPAEVASTAPSARPDPSTVAVPAASAPVEPSPPAPRTSSPRPAAARPNAASPAPPVAKGGCNPPYVIDASGHHKYKPECL